MPVQEPKGPFCQSCGMPLEKPDDFGTDQAGYRVNNFCHYCFANGAFTDPKISMEAMLETCVSAMTRLGAMPEGQARIRMTDVLPRLKRWQVPAANAR